MSTPQQPEPSALIRDLVEDPKNNGDYRLDITGQPLTDLWRACERVEGELRATKAELARVHELIQDPVAVRVNILRGTIKVPDDCVFMHDTDGPVAKLKAELASERAAGAELRKLADRLAEGVEALTFHTQHGHPGAPCERTGWINAQQMDEFRDSLKAYRARQALAAPTQAGKVGP